MRPARDQPGDPQERRRSRAPRREAMHHLGHRRLALGRRHRGREASAPRPQTTSTKSVPEPERGAEHVQRVHHAGQASRQQVAQGEGEPRDAAPSATRRRRGATRARRRRARTARRTTCASDVAPPALSALAERQVLRLGALEQALDERDDAEPHAAKADARRPRRRAAERRGKRRVALPAAAPSPPRRMP